MLGGTWGCKAAFPVKSFHLSDWVILETPDNLRSVFMIPIDPLRTIVLARHQGELSLAGEILQSNGQLANALDTEGVNW